MKTYKDLHLARDLKSLDLMICDKRNKIRNVDARRSDKLLKKFYETAQQNCTDQETMYIFLGLYIYFYDNFMKKLDDQKYVDLMYGREYKKVCVQFEEIKNILVERYANKNEAELPISVEREIESLPIDETKTNIFNDEFITCDQLYSALQKYNLLLVDARPQADFQLSRLNDPKVINVPEECITSGLSARTLGLKLPEETQKIWNKRDSYDVLVLFDWNSSSDNLVATKLEKLRTALVDYDMNRTYKERPVILNGGYVELLQTYPSLCTNPQVVLSARNNELDELLDIDDITYPMEADNKMHVMGDHESMKQQIGSPFEENNQVHFIEETTQITLEMDETKQKIDETEKELHDIHNQLNKEIDENNREKLKYEEDHEQEKLIILKQHLNDITNKKNTIEEHFDLYAHFDPETSESDIHHMMNDDIEKLKILEAIRAERNIALEKARAAKPKIDENIESPKVPRGLKPKTNDPPKVNRLNKPQLPMEVPFKGPQPSGLVGLRNIKNTCYMNAAIQCFRYVPCIRNLFCSGRYVGYDIRNPPAIIVETARVIRKLWKNSNKSLDPIEFYNKICTLNPIYRQGQHEDSMEFFFNLLNHLSDDCTYDVERQKVLTPKQIAWCNQFQGKNSVFIDMFYHQIRIQQSCDSCPSTTQKFEMENSFMLTAPDTEYFDLEESMNQYLADFTIADFRCGKCRRAVLNKKQICYFPKVAVLILKRYRQVPSLTNGTFIMQKTDARCRFPETLPLPAVTAQGKVEKINYTLNSIVLHSGDLQFGHYTAACLTKDGWYEFNDEVVRPTNINDDIIKSKAVAFFYSRTD